MYFLRLGYLPCNKLLSLGGGQGFAPICDNGVLPWTTPGESGGGCCTAVGAGGKWMGAATSPCGVCTIW